MSEHNVILFCLGTDDTLLTLGVFLPRISLSALVTTEGSLSSRGRVTSTVWRWRRCIVFSWSLRNGFERSSMVSSTFFSRSKFPVADENSMNGTALCRVTATTMTKFSMLRSITLFPYDSLGVSPERSSPLHSLPNENIDGESSTK